MRPIAKVMCLSMYFIPCPCPHIIMRNQSIQLPWQAMFLCCRVSIIRCCTSILIDILDEHASDPPYIGQG